MTNPNNEITPEQLLRVIEAFSPEEDAGKWEVIGGKVCLFMTMNDWAEGANLTEYEFDDTEKLRLRDWLAGKCVVIWKTKVEYIAVDFNKDDRLIGSHKGINQCALLAAVAYLESENA